MIHFYAFITTLISVGLKGFQHKNVIGNHYRLVFITSYLMAVADVLIIGIIVRGGWIICFASGSGAAIGMIISIWLHNKYVNKI